MICLCIVIVTIDVVSYVLLLSVAYIIEYTLMYMNVYISIYNKEIVIRKVKYCN
jgi:hypothetical protein